MSLNTILATAPLTTQNYHLKMIGTSIGNSLIWDNGTNVGIGNTNTSYTLDVSGTGRFTSTLLVSGAATFSSSVTAVGLFSTTSASGTLAAKIRNGTTSASGATGYGLAIESEASAATSYALTVRNLAESTTYFLISTETGKVGNVGIGTSSPSALLHLVQSASNLNLYLQNTLGSGKTWAVNSDTNGNFNIHDTTANRLTITSGGSVGVGVTPKTYASTWVGFQVGNFSLMSPAPSTDQNAILGANVYRATDNTWKRIIAGYGNLIEFNQGSGDIRTYTGGNSSADSTVSFVSGPFLLNAGVSWTNGSSDIRKKKNFETSQGLAELLQIEAVKYHFNWDEDNAKKRLGFKAQNLQNLIPEIVSETGEIAEDGSPYLTITPDYILPTRKCYVDQLDVFGYNR